MNIPLKHILVTSALSLSLFCNANSAIQDKTPQTPALNEDNISIAKQALMNRLNGFNHFSATFSQQVIDEEKNILQEGQGKFSVKKPNLVYWETQQPEESLIVSDGNTLWFFDPFIEQATAYRVDASVANTPILLLTSSDDALWQQYSVTQSNSDNFLIHSNDINSRVKTLELNFLIDSAILESFSIFDSTGQLSVIKLNDVTINEEIDSSLFQFTVPKGVFLDDQR
jgi:outer membrane lipoprotein carrier protein